MIDDSDSMYQAYQYAVSQGTDPFSDEGRMNMANHILGDNPTYDQVQQVKMTLGTDGAAPPQQSEADQAQQAREAAAARTKQSVQPEGGRKEGAVTNYLDTMGSTLKTQVEDMAKQPFTDPYGFAINMASGGELGVIGRPLGGGFPIKETAAKLSSDIKLKVKDMFQGGATSDEVATQLGIHPKVAEYLRPDQISSREFLSNNEDLIKRGISEGQTWNEIAGNITDNTGRMVDPSTVWKHAIDNGWAAKTSRDVKTQTRVDSINQAMDKHQGVLSNVADEVGMTIKNLRMFMSRNMPDQFQQYSSKPRRAAEARIYVDKDGKIIYDPMTGITEFRNPANQNKKSEQIEDAPHPLETIFGSFVNPKEDPYDKAVSKQKKTPDNTFKSADRNKYPLTYDVKDSDIPKKLYDINSSLNKAQESWKLGPDMFNLEFRSMLGRKQEFEDRLKAQGISPEEAQQAHETEAQERLHKILKAQKQDQEDERVEEARARIKLVDQNSKIKPGKILSREGDEGELYDRLVPEERQTSGNGISHPGYRHDIYTKDNKFLGTYVNLKRARRNRDRLDNEYGSYNHIVRTRQARPGELTKEEKGIFGIE